MSVAPSSQGAKNSQTEASKLLGVFCTKRSCGSKAKVSSIHCMWLSRAWCAIMTPLGRPVEPEV